MPMFALNLIDHKLVCMHAVRVAKSLDEACNLLEVGFEYVTDMDDVKLFRKRK